MMKWCAYCQEFQGEVAPIENLNMTHGICAPCMAKGHRQLQIELDHSERLRGIQEQLRKAGESGDMEAASRIVHLAHEAGVRSIDMLLGLVSPLLYTVGADWESGQITIRDEHRFTAFCERVFELVQMETAETRADTAGRRRPLAFLVNARGNIHTLGVRMIGLWLQSKGVETREFAQTPSPEALLDLVAEARPQAVLISMALAGQRDYVSSVARQIEGMAEPRPMMIVGGYAIKRQLVAPIAGAVFLETVTGLSEMIWAGA